MGGGGAKRLGLNEVALEETLGVPAGLPWHPSAQNREGQGPLGRHGEVTRVSTRLSSEWFWKFVDLLLTGNITICSPGSCPKK